MTKTPRVSKSTIALINPPLRESGIRSSQVLRRILETAGYSIRFLSDDVTSRGVESRARGLRERFVLNDLWSCFRLIRMRRNLGRVVFHIGAPSMSFSIAASRIMGLSPTIVFSGSESRSAFLAYEKTHGRLVANLVARYFRIREKLCYSFAASILVFQNSLIDCMGLDQWRQKCKVVGPLAIDTSIFVVSVPYGNRSSLVGYVGRLEEGKGLRPFIESLPRLVSRNDSVQVVVVGDGPMRSELQEFVESRNLGKRVRFTGWVSSDEVSRYLNQMRLCIVPSYTEAVPQVIMQAMACGTPVLAARVGGINETLDNGNLGFLFDHTASEDLADLTLRILDDEGLSGLSDKVSEYAHQEFSFRNVARRYREALS